MNNEKLEGKKIVSSLIYHVIEEFVRKPPYIMMISKKQLMWGNGIFKNSEYPGGLMKGLDLKRPSDKRINEMRNFYGYPAMITPDSFLNTIINSSMRQELILNTIDDRKYSDVRVICGKGYILPDGTLDRNKTQGMSCYCIFAASAKYIEIQQDWIKDQEKYVRLQIYRNQMTHEEILLKQNAQAKKKISDNNKLLKQTELHELESGISRNEVTWELGE